MYRSLRLSFLVTVLVGCHEPTRGCDVCTFSALVYGTVTSSTGALAAGAIVKVYTAHETCDAPSASHAATAVADGSGRYRMQVVSGVYAPACVQVEASPAADAPGTERITIPPVQFKRTSEASLPYDSVRVDVHLP